MLKGSAVLDQPYFAPTLLFILSVWLILIPTCTGLPNRRK